MRMKFLKNIGPGIVVAATGVGAGDMIAASVAGAKYGTVIIWAAIVGAVIKFVLNEGMARWQLATGTTVETTISYPGFIILYGLSISLGIHCGRCFNRSLRSGCPRHFSFFFGGGLGDTSLVNGSSPGLCGPVPID